MRKLGFLFLLMFLLVVPVVFSAKTEVIQLSENSLTVVYPKTLYHPENVAFNLSFDVLNSTYSRLNSSVVDCSFFLNDNVGESVCSGSLIYSSSLNYWYYEVNNSNVLSVGTYNWYVHCNASNGENGFVSSDFFITRTGSDTEFNNDSFLVVGFVFICLFLSSLLGLILLKPAWLKIILANASTFLLMIILRFSSWFVLITNPEQTNFIDTLDKFYMFGIWLFVGVMVMSLIFLVIHILNSLSMKERRSKDKEWGW